ncbi:MAG: AAA family ATPase [Parcubacteria group bacterium]|jgi:dephospho-CoA kinase
MDAGANKKIIIGLVGEAGSGKDTVADYLGEKHNAVLLRFADPLREALSLYIDNFSREDLGWLSISLRKRFGNKVLSEALRKRIRDVKEGIVVINGLRLMEDLEFMNSIPGATVIYITLDSKSRWERMYNRGEKTDDAVSYEDFLKMEKTETEEQIPMIGEKADIKVENTATKEDLFAKIDQILDELGQG